MQFSALWHPLPYSSPCTTTRSGAPLGGGASGGPGPIPGRFWRTGVPSFRRCSAEPVHSGSVKYRCRSAIALTIALPGPWPRAPETKTKKTHLRVTFAGWQVKTSQLDNLSLFY